MGQIVIDFKFIENVLLGSPFTWGKRDLSNPNEYRSKYINALQEADNGNYIPLLAHIPYFQHEFHELSINVQYQVLVEFPGHLHFNIP